MMRAALGFGAAGLLPIPEAGAKALPRAADASVALQSAIAAATGAGRAFVLPAGTVRTAALRLPDGAQLIGSPGSTRLVLEGEGPLLTADRAARIALSGLALDGASRSLDGDRGLIDFSNVGELTIADCAIERSGGVGLRLRSCGGRVERNAVRDIAAGGLFTTDATGLVIDDNRVERCGDNGIQVWRSVRGDDGSRVSGNHIADIKNVSGGAGQYGNGVSLFRAGGVLVTNNTIRRCAFTAVRNNGGIGRDRQSEQLRGSRGDRDIRRIRFRRLHHLRQFDRWRGLRRSDGQFRRQPRPRRRLRRQRHSQSADPRPFRPSIRLRMRRQGRGGRHGSRQRDRGRAVGGDSRGLGDVVAGRRGNGNVVRDAPIGIGVSIAEGAGAAVIADNMISGASRGAVLGMNLDRPVTADLARGGPRRRN